MVESKKEFYWKSINLSSELSIAGNFIYNGLKNLHQIEIFFHQDEIFDFLYNVAVGIERLEKICIILIEHGFKSITQEEFETSLITHNHMTLLDRIKNTHKLNFGSEHNSFIQLIQKFYKSYRYYRYNYNDKFYEHKELVSLKDFFDSKIGCEEIGIEGFKGIINNTKTRKFTGKVIGKICAELFNVLKTECDKQNLYAYELRSNCKAFKIFYCKQYDFTSEDMLLKELLVYFLQYEGDNKRIKILREIVPLDFDDGLITEYFKSFTNEIKRTEIVEEMNEHLIDILHEDKAYRKEILGIIDNENVRFCDDPESMFPPLPDIKA